jgi:hypothetical protein
MFFLLSFVFYSIKLENKRVEQVLPEVGRGEVVQIRYTHVSKCKNYKLKKKRIPNPKPDSATNLAI